MAIAAPVLEAEMADWVALGGGNSGIVGNKAHTYGAHLGANEIPADDYTRWRDPNGADGPYVDWSYAVAGDFSHRNDEKLRAMHRAVLAGLMAGKYPMICEFIGKPWHDRPVYYWARWNGVTTLRLYTGAGHDHWSHIAWYRSMVDQRAYLWTPGPSTQEADMATIVRNNDGSYWALGADGVPHRLALKSAKGIDDVGWIVSGRAGVPAGLGVYTNAPIDREPWIDIPTVLVDVLAVVPDQPAPAASVDEVALAKALAPLLGTGGLPAAVVDALEAVVAAARGN